ncbi:hypothetical protein SAMN02910358_00453 [Lachnospiraceae bacterium XBB1006]|nr:hypothetical protein SAMN02910358_00453 [Lachnospiraceae bacterium XBB1006]
MKNNWVKRVTSVAMATAMIFATCTAMPAQAKGFTFRGSHEPTFLKEENRLSKKNVATIKEMVAGLSENKYKAIRVDDYVSVYNVDSQETFFLYPVYCDGTMRFAAHVSEAGDVSVTDNLEALVAIGWVDAADVILYVDDGVYYAESKDGTTKLSDEHYVIHDDKYSFDGLTYEEKLDVMDDNGAEFETFGTKMNKFGVEKSFNNNDTTDGWWDWWWDDPGQNQGQTVTKKCGITNFLLQGNYGLCWACTVGTITNFMTGRNLTGKNVADMMGIGYDDGATIDQIRTALGCYGLSFSVYNNKLPFSQIKNNVNADKPFGICLSTYNAGHAITGYGYSYNTANTSSNASTNLVYAWDSNGYQISFAQNASRINTSGYSFSWYGSVY